MRKFLLFSAVILLVAASWAQTAPEAPTAAPASPPVVSEVPQAEAPKAESPRSEATPVAEQTPTSGNSSQCHSLGSCSACAEQSGCVWCEESGTCFEGNFLGPEDKSCGWEYRWNFCMAPTRILLLVAAGVVALLLLCIIICICRCCCCSGRKKGSKGYDKLPQEPTQYEIDAIETGSRHPKTDAKRRELEEKYGRSFGRRTHQISDDY
eukprot:TRINITY_DN2047_c0_g1_i1.p1 TRINITY_DN2047_c0_g1~~TRINITY_DN2047_c0_g1_i1.p1  ORF type:complete len:228 (+),score=35.69 TRINITY_DN2047_c0_g1_i1:60-686(+)